VLLVEGLFLVVSAIGPHGLDSSIRDAAGTAGGLRLAGAAAAGANLANNLPAYLALERVVPQGHLLDVLLGVNLGPLITPWGSLATLLWMDRCRARGVHVSALQYAVAGLLVVPPLLVVAFLALRVCLSRTPGLNPSCNTYELRGQEFSTNLEETDHVGHLASRLSDRRRKESRSCSCTSVSSTGS
jgi:hypothetical protein